jgi:beta-xylosidase
MVNIQSITITITVTMSSACCFSQGGNPIIKETYTADPAAIVFHDTVYLYTGHDETPAGVQNYIMHDWSCFSSVDMVHWVKHTTPLRATDFTWVKDGAWASQVVARNGKFYWYVAVEHKSIPAGRSAWPLPIIRPVLTGMRGGPR